MRSPEVPIEGVNDQAEELDSPEIISPLALRLAEAIEGRVESENGSIVVFNRHFNSHVVLEASYGKLIADWHTNAKGYIFEGRIALSGDGSILGMSASVFHRSHRHESHREVIDPRVPYRIEEGRLGSRFHKYEVPLNTVVQIAEEGDVI